LFSFDRPDNVFSSCYKTHHLDEPTHTQQHILYKTWLMCSAHVPCAQLQAHKIYQSSFLYLTIVNSAMKSLSLALSYNAFYFRHICLLLFSLITCCFVKLLLYNFFVLGQKWWIYYNIILTTDFRLSADLNLKERKE